ncbi:MAG TPA: sulfite reductase flavoprotein subunit alpha, partial [Candidatus Dormibacteraeota bacterium]|nr:sulfite reductase flavoprotein subunit alpha [Candidatus Dormibacteraeota bacterium]
MPTVPIIPENAPFSAAQRLWLNGFLAGLFTESAPAANADSLKAKAPLLIIFGTQTGTAEGLARRIASEANARGFSARVLDAASAPKVGWATESNLLIVTSTYGDGDMPDNAQGFWNWLQTDAANALAHLNFSVLALGDSNYEHFCAAGKKFDARLEGLGAKRVHLRADCDVDYETTAKTWQEAVLTALGGADALDCQAGQSALEASSARVTETAGHSKSKPFPARLVANRKLSGEGSGKEVRHFEISLEGSSLAYEAGDALGVFPTNCPSLVNDFLHALGCDGEEAVPAPGGGEVRLRKALHECYEITKCGTELLQRVAEHNRALRELLAAESKEPLKKWLWAREVIDLFLETPGLSFSPAEFVALLKPLSPRLYSISSSPKAHAGQVHLTVNIVRYDSWGRTRKGVCSSFLADRASAQSPVPVFVQKSHGFRLPASGDTPIIMVGPGTGIAPFRAFLHERQASDAKGRNWLFFGEQRAATDFYYRDELEAMQASGHLTRLRL